jgi:sortase A
MAHHEHRDALQWLQRLAVAVGVTCLAWAGMVTLQATLHDRQQRSLFEQQRVASGTSEASSTPPPSTMQPSNGLIGLLEIPRLGFSEIVMHGDDDDTLTLAIGHLPDTPLPWQPGNSARAGHREGRFRPLKDIRIGDRITIATRQGNLHYVLRETKIVTPDDLSVLAPTDARTLTLITCYPFSYVGKAPRRFILKAEAVGGPVFRDVEQP